MKAKDIMTKEVIAVKQGDSIEHITNLLLEHRIGGAPVIDEAGKVIGIISETDLMYKDKDINVPAYYPFIGGYILLESVRKFEEQLKKIAAYRVEDIMSTPVTKVFEEQEIKEIVNLMLENKINRIPVIDKEEKLVGIIARSDILRAI